MKRQAVTFLIVGLIIESVGYMIDKAEFFGFMVPVLSPTYVDGVDAVRALRSGTTLTPLSSGFDAVVYLFKEEARRQNPANIVNSLSVTRVRPGNAALAFTVGGAESRLPLFLDLSNGEEIQWETGRVEAALLSLKERRLTLASLVVFLFGIALQIVGFVVYQQQDSKAQP